jgi:hypothetical protein
MNSRRMKSSQTLSFVKTLATLAAFTVALCSVAYCLAALSPIVATPLAAAFYILARAMVKTSTYAKASADAARLLKRALDDG